MAPPDFKESCIIIQENVQSLMQSTACKKWSTGTLEEKYWKLDKTSQQI